MTHAGTSPSSMNRRLFLRSTCPLLLFPVSAMTSEGATKKGQTIMYKIPLLEVIEKTAIRHKALVNGFDAGLMISVRSNQKKQVSGLKTKLTSYCALHPYFLKRGANELRLEYTLDPSYAAPEDRGPWTLDCRVASINYSPGKELGTTFSEKELLRLTSPALRKGEESGMPKSARGTFDWPEGPDWSWTKGEKIEDTAANRKSLEAAASKFWNELNGVAGKPVPASLAASVRASVQEFIQASELRGRRFTFLDELLETASKLALPGDKTPEEFLREREQQQKKKNRGAAERDDEESGHPPVARLANGQLPPRVALRKLDTFDGLEMSLMGDGHLARLSGTGGESLIQFVSNYHDGPRGRPDETRLKCDLWFRKNKEWELSAVYPTLGAGMVLESNWPQELFEMQPY
jgi:hypothetical protein